MLNKTILENLSKPISSDVDHLDVLLSIYNKYIQSGTSITNIIRYYLNGLDEIPLLKHKYLWKEEAFWRSRKLFDDSFPGLLEILQNDYNSFKYNFKIIASEDFSVKQFSDYPLWSECYDYEELDDIESWGFKREIVLKELQEKKIDGSHPYYTVPIHSFPLNNMRFFTKAKFTTKSGFELEGAIMNEGEFGILIFIGDEYEVLTQNSESEKVQVKISKYYAISMVELKELEFETVIPVDLNKRIKGVFAIS